MMAGSFSSLWLSAVFWAVIGAPPPPNVLLPKPLVPNGLGLSESTGARAVLTPALKPVVKVFLKSPVGPEVR